MERSVRICNRAREGEFFRGLILPEVYPEMEKDEVFLVGAEEEDEPVGAALWRLEENMASLLSIGVAKEHQRKGIGTALLNCSMRLLRQMNCPGIYALTQPGEEAAAGLLQSFGMTAEEGAIHYSISLADILKAKNMQTSGCHTKALQELTNSQYDVFVNRCFGGEAHRWKRDFFDSVCSRFILQNQRICAGIFVEKEEEELSVAWIHSTSRRPEDILYLFQDSAVNGMECYGESTLVRFSCFDEPLQKIVEKLFGEKMVRTSLEMWSLSGYRYRLSGRGQSAWEMEET